MKRGKRGKRGLTKQELNLWKEERLESFEKRKQVTFRLSRTGVKTLNLCLVDHSHDR